jgi:hypothetical protein
LDRIPEERSVKILFKNIPEGKQLFGKPGNRWLGDVENDLKEARVSGWTKYLRIETFGN